MGGEGWVGVGVGEGGGGKAVRLWGSEKEGMRRDGEGIVVWCARARAEVITGECRLD